MWQRATATSVLLTCACVLLDSTIASAERGQDLSGQLMGVVSDAGHAAVPDVSVTVEGPALARPRTQQTSGGGRYHFVMLPPGTYSLSFAKNGFRSVRREAIDLTLQTTLTVHVSLESTTLPREIVVERGGPSIDTGNMSVGTSYRDEAIEDIPTGRDLWAVLAIAPGFQMRGIDVGGSRGSEVGYAVYGVETGHRTVVEGLVVDNSRTTNAGYFDLDSFSEIRVGGSGSPLEAGGPGALINLSVKSGGDTFHGDGYFDFMNDALVGDNVGDDRALFGLDEDGFRWPGFALSQGNRITNHYDASGGVGGRIVARKLWFFGAGRDALTYRNVLGLPDFDNESRLRNATAKLTYALSAGNQLTGFYSWRSKIEPTRGVSVSTSLESTINQVGEMQLGKVQWTSVLSPSLVLDLQGGLHSGRNNMGAYGRDGTSLDGVPVGRQASTGVMTGGGTGLPAHRRLASAGNRERHVFAGRP